MLRSIFLALGLMGILFGMECLLIDSASLYSARETQASSFFNPASNPASSANLWRPREWTPWVALTVGTIVILYAFTLPRRFRRTAVA